MTLIESKSDFEKVIILKIVAEKQNKMLQEMFSDIDEAKYIIRDLKQQLHDKQVVAWSKEDKAEYRKEAYYKQIKAETDAIRRKLGIANIKIQQLTTELIKVKN